MGWRCQLHRVLCLSATFIIVVSCSESTAPIVQPPLHVQQDTTSHEVEWTIYKFGPGIPSSSLRDIIAFSPDDVWAVGNVYDDEPDSSGRYSKPYNALHWNGSVWEKRRITLYNCDPDLSGVDMIWSIEGEDNGFLVCNSSGAGAFFNGNEFVPRCIKADFSVWYGAATEDICYVSEREWYFVGNNLGKGEVTIGQPPYYNRVVHLEGMPINRVVSDGRGNVWACGFDYLGHASFMRVTESHELQDLRKYYKVDGHYKFGGLSSLWISKDSLYGAFGAFLYVQALYDTSHYRFMSQIGIDPFRAVKWCMDGTGDNDVFMAGSFNSVVHYNGRGLHYYPDIYQSVGGGDINGICVNDNYIYLCGSNMSTHAFVAIGRRLR